MTRIWRASYFLTTLYLFWHASGLKVSTNERTSWIGCVRRGKQCWGASGQFLKPFQRHVLKCDAYITLCMHALGFKAAFFLLHALTDGITRTLHARSFFRCLIWNDTGYSARWNICACIWRAHATSTASIPHSFNLSEMSPIWCGHKDVLHLNKRNPLK